MKKTYFAIIMGLMLALGLQAQERSYYPNAFVSVEGGVTRTFVDAGIDRKWAPMGAVSVGGYMSPWLGARLQADAWQWKQQLPAVTGDLKSTYLGGSADLLVNLTGIFRPQQNLFNLVFVAGTGIVHGSANTGELTSLQPLPVKHHHWAHTAKLGGQVDLAFTEKVGALIEGGYNFINDHQNSRDRWWPYLMAGVRYNFAFGKAKATRQPEPAPVVEQPKEPEPQVVVTPAEPRKPDLPKPAPAPEPKPEPKIDTKPQIIDKAPEMLYECVFFTIADSDVAADQQATIDKVAAWAKSHPRASFTLSGYADKGTGNDKINQRLSERRVAKVKDALVKAGIDSERLTTRADGDKVQPFDQNDKNRVVVVQGIDRR